MNQLEARIKELQSLRLSRKSEYIPKHWSFSGIRFVNYGENWSCEIWFANEFHAKKEADSIVGAFESALGEIMSDARVVSLEEYGLMDLEIERNWAMMYDRWAKEYPGERFNLILAMDRGLINSSSH